MFERVRNTSSLEVISLSSLYCHPAVIRETKYRGLECLVLLLFKKINKYYRDYRMFFICSRTEYEQTAVQRMVKQDIGSISSHSQLVKKEFPQRL